MLLSALAHWQAPNTRGDLFYARSAVNNRNLSVDVNIGLIDVETDIGIGVDHKVMHLGYQGVFALKKIESK